MKSPRGRLVGKLRASFGAGLALLMLAQAGTTPAAAQSTEIFSISDQIRAENDCYDQTNEACKSMFENTCYWAEESAVTLRDGLAQSIPMDRIFQRMLGELVEISEGSGGYIDLDLADSMIEPMIMYFTTGQYDAEFAQFNDQASLALGMMLGATINGSAEQGTAEEGLSAMANRRDELLRQKWFSTCMQTAYF